MASGKLKDKESRLRSAAVVKCKYLMLAGAADDGFKQIFSGVLQDLELEEQEVDRFLEEHRAEIEQLCRKG